MYVPPAFGVDDDAAWGIVADAGLGVWAAVGPDGLVGAFAPVLVSDDRSTLRAHVARANPFWRALGDGAEVLVTFLAASAYVSPALYPSRVAAPGVVPTWNYAAAEVRGTARVVDDAAWLRELVTDLTDRFEEGLEPRWWVSESPDDYVERQLRAIVGIVVTVASIQGKAKLSQNRPEEDRASVRDAFATGSSAERIVASRMP
ncbi:MAG TPA: FMN-binding negative transcriptional regulator [Acidimicrobiales bacterium]|nr:FMN-binding negative transcriptional regulator [Acidimicrobiales bacterium]